MILLKAIARFVLYLRSLKEVLSLHHENNRYIDRNGTYLEVGIPTLSSKKGFAKSVIDDEVTQLQS